MTFGKVLYKMRMTLISLRVLKTEGKSRHWVSRLLSFVDNMS